MNNSLFPQDIYLTRLTTINRISFTQREVDVLACLLKVRSTSKIASLLNVASCTVITHIRHLMEKTACNSREGIVDFIERSSKLPIIKDYYVSLVRHAAFEKSLRDIAKLKPRVSLAYLNIYVEELSQSHVLLLHLTNHLRQAGLHAEIQEGKTKNILLLSFSKEDHHKIIDQGNSFSSIHLAPHQSYHLCVLKILEIVLPSINIPLVFSKFIKCYEEKVHLQENTVPALDVPLSIKHQKKPRMVRKKRKSYILIIFFTAVLGALFFILFKNNFHQKELTFLRSELTVPTNAVFLPRPELLSLINDKFKTQEQMSIQTIALIGIGGAGKTTLARQYAHQQNADVVWEINAETRENLQSSFENLAQVLAKTEEAQKILRGWQDIKNPKEKEERLIEFVKTHLRSCVPWCIIYDNVENFSDIQKYFPHNTENWGKGKIILTTRDSNIQTNKYISEFLHIGELTPNQKLILFTKIMENGNSGFVPTTQKAEIQQFLEKIPSYPLDVSIASYYIKTTNISYPAYLNNLIKNNKAFEVMQKTVLKEAGEYTKTRQDIIRLSLDHLIHTYGDFIDLLLFCSLISPQSIPRILLDEYKDNNAVDNFIYNLKKYSLITNGSYSSSNQSLIMHRSTQKIIFEYITNLLNIEKNKHLLQPIEKILKNHMAAFIEKEDLLQIKNLVTHYEAFLNHKLLLTETEQGSLESELGGAYIFLSNYPKAKKFLEAGLLKLNKQANESKESRARCLSYLGNVYGDLGAYEKAKDVLEESLTLYKKYFPEEYIKIAWVLAYLGNMYRDLGNYQKAKDLLEESYLIYKRQSPIHPISFARVSTYLGIVYTLLGNYENAKNLLNESLSIYKEHIAENPVSYAWVLAHLGNVYAKSGLYEKGRNFLEESLMVYKKYFPEDHIKTAWALYSLGDIYRNLGNYQKAKNLLEQSLAIYNKHLSENHFATAGILSCLGDVYRDLGNYKTAQNLLEKSLKIYKSRFSENHIKIAWILAHLGSIHGKLAENKRAKDLLKQSLKIYKKHFSEDHPEVIWASTCLKEINHESSTYKEKSK